MRRRLLGATTKLTFSEYEYVATPAAVQRDVYVYYGGKPITDMTASMFTRTNNMNVPTINNTNGKITVKVSGNTLTSSSVTSILTFTYKDQIIIYTVIQPKDYVINSTTEVNYLYDVSLGTTSITIINNKNSSPVNLYLIEEKDTYYYDNYASGNKRFVNYSETKNQIETVTLNANELTFETKYNKYRANSVTYKHSSDYNLCIYTNGNIETWCNGDWHVYGLVANLSSGNIYNLLLNDEGYYSE